MTEVSSRAMPFLLSEDEKFFREGTGHNMEDDFEYGSTGAALPPMDMEVSVDELELSIRSYNCLKRAGINSVDELCELTPDDLAHIHNLGRKSYEEIIERLEAIGRKLKPEQSSTNSDEENFVSETKDEIQSSFEKIFIKHGLQILKDGKDVAAFIRDEMPSSRERNIAILIFEGGDDIKPSDSEAIADLVRRDICERLTDEYGISKDVSEPVVQKLQKAIDNAKKVRKNQFGKSICKTLKEMRRQFADANGIEYEEDDCKNPNPCTGTCPYCEEKNKYLLDEAAKLSQKKDVVYPDFILSDTTDEDDMEPDRFKHADNKPHVLAGCPMPDPEWDKKL